MFCSVLDFCPSPILARLRRAQSRSPSLLIPPTLTPRNRSLELFANRLQQCKTWFPDPQTHVGIETGNGSRASYPATSRRTEEVYNISLSPCSNDDRITGSAVVESPGMPGCSAWPTWDVEAVLGNRPALLHTCSGIGSVIQRDRQNRRISDGGFA